jgi:hypothetical protein
VDARGWAENCVAFGAKALATAVGRVLAMGNRGALAAKTSTAVEGCGLLRKPEAAVLPKTRWRAAGWRRSGTEGAPVFSEASPLNTVFSPLALPMTHSVCNIPCCVR